MLLQILERLAAPHIFIYVTFRSKNYANCYELLWQRVSLTRDMISLPLIDLCKNDDEL